MMTNNGYQIRIHECGILIPVAYFWVNSTGCSDEFHVVFKHTQNLENLYVENFEGKTAYLLPS